MLILLSNQKQKAKSHQALFFLEQRRVQNYWRLSSPCFHKLPAF